MLANDDLPCPPSPIPYGAAYYSCADVTIVAPSDMGLTGDLGPFDLARPVDFARPADLAASADLARSADLAGPVASGASGCRMGGASGAGFPLWAFALALLGLSLRRRRA